MIMPREIPRLLSLLLLFGALCACGRREPAVTPEPARAAAPSIVVRLGFQKIGPPFLLKERAQRLQERLAAAGARAEWVEFQAGPPLLEAMRGGGVDIGYTGEAPPIFAQAGGVPFVYVANDPPSPRAEAILVAADSPIRSASELKGKRIALNRGSNVHYLLLRALERAGLSVADVTPVYLAPPDARSAFQSGEVEAWVIWDPFLAAAEQQGARRLVDGEGLVKNRFYYLARREFADKHAALLRIVLDEYSGVSDWAAAHPEQTARLLADASGVPYDALLASERRHVYGVQAVSRAILDEQQAIADAFVKLAIIPREIRTHDAYAAAGGSAQ
jgi:sulfonate transport system substrate-binding protein